MNQPTTPQPPPRPGHGRHLMDEPDIGSGEKTPGEMETEEQIRQIPPLKPSPAAASVPVPR
jgi:hypothetical protein